MDNNAFQQPMQPGQPVQPVQPIQPAAPQNTPLVTMEQAEIEHLTKKTKKGNLIQNSVIAVLGILMIMFAVLFFMKDSEYKKLNKDIDATVASEVADLADARLTELEQEFDERDKKPYSTFVGPEDYGRLQFSYPRTYSMYVVSDATDGKDYQAYFHPNQVQAIDSSHVYALQLDILNSPYDTVVTGFEGESLTRRSYSVNGQNAAYFTGTLPGTEFDGYMVVIKIRDKTVVLRTFDVIFKQDFDQIIDSITFNS